MSTYWGYKCLDCDVESEDTWFNHGEEILIEAVELYDCMKQINLSDYWTVVCSISSCEGFQAITFLVKHENHNIVLLNEYGKTKEIKHLE